MKLTKADLGDGLDWGNTIMAALLLASIGARFWRHPESFGFFEFAPLAIAAVGVVMIWLLSLKHRMILRTNAGQEGNKSSGQLNALNSSSAFFAYLMVGALLNSVHRH
jgi:hypothetical protein